MTGFFFVVVVQNCTMISDCSPPPLGCNGVNSQKLWKTGVGQLCSKTSKENLFWGKICHKWEDPTFSTLKDKTTWSNMQKSPVVRSIITPYICNSATSPHCSRHHTNTTNDSLCWKELTQSKNPGITRRWDKHLRQVRTGVDKVRWQKRVCYNFWPSGRVITSLLIRPISPLANLRFLFTSPQKYAWRSDVQKG